MKKDRQIQPTNKKNLGSTNGPAMDVRLGLKNIKAFLSLIGNPQNKIAKTIHIAGTNGKGSTLAFLQSLCMRHSLKIGKYTSPHLQHLTERFQINNENILEAELNKFFTDYSHLKEFEELTYFEQLTSIAYSYFEKEKVDWLLLETGLGGRLDATNIIERPKLCLITNIGLDHQEFLGNTLEEIAYEKAGILKAGVPFITTAEEPALAIIRKQAQKVGASEIELEDFEIDEYKLGLQGLHQKKNATLSLNAYKFLTEQNLLENNFNLDEALKVIYSQQNWPGRMQEVMYNKNKIILDGAHNEASALALKVSLAKIRQNRKTIWLMGFLKNKNYQTMIKTLLQNGDFVIFTLPSSKELSADLLELQSFVSSEFKDIKVICQEKVETAFTAFNELIQEQNNCVAVVAGSLYLVGTVLNLLDN